MIYVMIDGAKDNFYASSLAAPLFSQVASYSVRRAGLSPSLLKEENMILSSQDIETEESQEIANKKSDRQIAFVDNSVPDLRGLTLREILNKTQGTGLKFKIHGSGELVRTIPFAGEPLPENKKITIIFH